MGKLKDARGDAYPTVEDIYDDIDTINTSKNGGSAELVTKGGDKYYYLLSIEDEIEDDPNDFKVVWSAKRNKAFIVEKEWDPFDF